MKKIRIHEGFKVIDLEKVRSAKYEENIERYGEHANTCFLCGKQTAEKLHVNCSTDGFLIPFGADDTDLWLRGIESQGYFPVGAECAKKAGRNYVVTLIK
jgi:hypothetical protein